MHDMTPYSAREVAEKLGLTPDGFYRARARLHAQDGLPAPIAKGGRLFWHRAAFDAWLDPRTRASVLRHAANDTTPPLSPEAFADDIDATRRFLAQVYGR